VDTYGECPLVESRQQPAPGRTIEQFRDFNPLAGLECLHCRLHLGCQEAIDRAWVKSEVLQTCFRDLNVARG
jgi:hypothetical protein